MRLISCDCIISSSVTYFLQQESCLKLHVINSTSATFSQRNRIEGGNFQPLEPVEIKANKETCA